MSLEGDATEGGLLGKLSRLLGKRSEATSFASLLYGRHPPENLGPVTLDALASNANEAWEFIAVRQRGQHKLRIRPISASAGGDGARLSLVEIVNDDMPFLVDSVLGELQARGLEVHLLLHPIYKATRDGAGRLQSIRPADQNWGDGQQESYIAIHTRCLSEAVSLDLANAISMILDQVRVVVADWKPMLRRLQAAKSHLEEAKGRAPAEQLNESTAFLQWLVEDNFTFLGTREYRLVGDPATDELAAVEGTGLGVLRDPHVQVLRRGRELVAMTPEVRRFFFAPAPLIITKASAISRVHRRLHMDYVGVKIYREDGSPRGELRIVGLFTSRAYVESPTRIPFLRHKVATVIDASGYPPASHDGKALLNILDTFPRDELFQIGPEQLQEWAKGILDLEVRPRVRVFARTDRFDRFVSALVFVPRDRYTTAVRERIGALLAETYNGRVSAFYPYFPSEGPLVRVQFIIGRFGGPTPAANIAELERRIADITRTWEDRLADAIAGIGDNAEALQAKYGAAFSAGYAETFSADRAVEDIRRIERLGPDQPVAIDFYRDMSGPGGRVHAAIYRFGAPIPLSERVPLLENLGFLAIDERSYRLTPCFADGVREVTLHDMALETSDRADIDLKTHDVRLEAAFLAVFRGDADNDGFNRLVVSAGADWREAAVLRAYASYLRQLGSPFGLRYLAETLNRHAEVARDFLELFHLRFDPARGFSLAERREAEGPLLKRIEGALAAVPSLDEDRILHQFLNLLAATVRTNFYQATSGQPLSTIAFKLDSKALDAAPQPRPFREIWVYSPRVEGVHLRFAPIARGGIRWSDRAQDFRTEVLGLARAQLVKNAVIVPSGAKGGFLPKLLPRGGSRDEIQREGIAAYRIFISALLDITDNIKDGKVVAPANLVRHDDDDPYLVVAADKGTATFSDIANEISAAHDFWLGDAFASGGSAGYDHKKMGITARGGWECVKRHFRELDVDIQRQPIRVIGVGDMSGDVFGNAMLLSPHIELVAAFDHRDIFLDPNPPADGFAERQRLFELPRSSWQDYNRAKLSSGGGVFSRTAKSIPVSSEVRQLLRIDAGTLTPNEFICAILRCEADLLWFGGIGTFVRGSTETDADVGDRTNDAIRVPAAELKVKVIGEGANLGLTQRARIEFGARGGRLNTDFIDNSAGVNTSDQEVNIKVALGPAVRTGKLSAEQRIELLASMTDDVAAGSLRNNYQQSLALSLAERRSARELFDYALLIRAMEERGLFDRKLEALPSDAEIAERSRAGKGLTRPELAVLLSYAKIALLHDLLESRVPDEPQLEGWLLSYFPPVLCERFAAQIAQHSLRREIIATSLTNAVVNRGGPAMAVRLADETRRAGPDVARAFLTVREVFELPPLWQRIDALDGKTKGETQLELYQATQALVQEQTRWFLRYGAADGDLAGLIGRFRGGLAELALEIEGLLPPRLKARLASRAQWLASCGVPADLAGEVARLDVLGCAPAVVEIASETGRSATEAARVYLEIGERLRITELAANAGSIATADQYDRLAVSQAMSQLAEAQGAFTRQALGMGGIAAWLARQNSRIDRVRTALDEISGGGTLTVSRLLVAAGQLSDLASARAAAP